MDHPKDKYLLKCSTLCILDNSSNLGELGQVHSVALTEVAKLRVQIEELYLLPFYLQTVELDQFFIETSCKANE